MEFISHYGLQYWLGREQNPRVPVEIERKFLVIGDYPETDAMETVQAYLCAESKRTVRIRIEPERAVLAIKGELVGFTRPEFEYVIPVEEARELGSVVEKTRYHHHAGPHVWEIDVFHGENEGLVVAEIELASEDEEFEKPSWLGAEVSGDSRYHNSALSKNPYTSW
jgi:CYTH domain-containing protein